MNTNVIGFDDAIELFAELLVQQVGAKQAAEGRLLRDMYGRLSFVTPQSLDVEHTEFGAAVESAGLSGWCANGPGLVISLSDDIERFDELIRETSIAVSHGHGPGLRLIDRRLAGDDWLVRPGKLVTAPARLVFYSVKGGVGRSTALAIAAADLAARGFNILILDLDLEAPGIGTLLLAAEDTPKYGVIDWFAAVAAGADANAMVPDMTGPSSFTSARAVVDVVPAAGHAPGAYLSKLARAYAPGSAGELYRGFSFPMKVDGLIRQLTALRHYDAVLIDARAGLHETSGGLVLGLGASTLIFGLDTTQTFEDFKLMFAAFAQAFDPAAGGEDTRYALKMVHAKAPRDDQDRQPFRERSWELWSDSLYDDTEFETELTGEAFVFDVTDEDAPHYPLEIIGDEFYARFDPRTQTYPLSAAAYESVFGRFLAGIRAMLGLA